MPPKAKGKAKAKAGDKAKPNDAPKMEVPAPPPTPVCLPLPEPLATKYAAERRLLLAWADPNGEYKVQVQSFTPGQKPPEPGTDEFADSWADVETTERVNLSGRSVHEGRLVPCEHVRLRYRLVAIPPPKLIDGKYAANWSSAPSEPIASFVDPPVDLKAEFCYDDSRPFVALTWQSSNIEWLRKAMKGEDGQATPSNPFEAWPGLLPVKVQVRWRPLRALREDGSLPRRLPQEVISPAVDDLPGGGSFSIEKEAWRLEYREALLGVTARFSVRVGTSYRWSPWSEETEEVELEVPEPKPLGVGEGQQSEEVRLRAVTDREADIAWPPFSTMGTLSEVEYRVMVCPLRGETAAPNWDKGIVAAIMQVSWENEISTMLRGLHPSTWYVVRIDARHPFVGKRAFSTSKAISLPFRTRFPSRPPLQPVPVALGELKFVDADEEGRAAPGSHNRGGSPRVDGFVDPEGSDVAPDDAAVGSASPAGSASPSCSLAGGSTSLPQQRGLQPLASERAPRYDWSTMPWVALRVESKYLTDYAVEYKDAAAAEGQCGGEFFEGWAKPVSMQVAEDDAPASPTSPTSPLSPAGSQAPQGDLLLMQEQWQTIRIGLGAAAPEEVVCRLVCRTPFVGISALQWNVVTPPLVSFVAPPTLGAPCIWPQVNDGSFGFVLRFFLQPMGAGQPPAAQSPGCLAGHRLVSRYQVRVRSAPKSNGAAPWAELAPRLLPDPCARHAPEGSEPVGVEQATSTDAALRADLVARLGWTGVRYEVPIHLAEEACLRSLLAGEPFETEVRVGSEFRWSAWTSVGEAACLAAPAPVPLSGCQFDCEPISATRLQLSWQPFERLPGVSRLQYLVRASPTFCDDGKDNLSEGSVAVERLFEVAHPMRQPCEELLQTREARRWLDGKGEVEVQQFVDLARAAASRERDADKDPANLVKVELAGLLPFTRYAVTVWARYPAASAFDGEGGGQERTLSADVATLGGAAAPPAPFAVPLGHVLADSEELAESTNVGARDALLAIGLHPGYVLEYRAAAPESAHFDSQSGPDRGRFAGSWQDEDGLWHEVPETKTLGAVEDGLVMAKLPGFDSQPFLPDVVEFRLRAAARSAAHPCRWVGDISTPIAVCIAPPHRSPRLRHVLADDRWCMSMGIELFKGASAPTPPMPLAKILQDEDEDDDSEGDEEENDVDMLALHREHLVPVPPREAWQDVADLRSVPVGYGHRMVGFVQFRYSLQSALVPTLRKQIEDKVASKKWQLSSPAPIGPDNLSASRCTIEVSSDAGPTQGGIYMFQARLGDGCRWSAWSPTSNAFAFRVPPPAPQRPSNLSRAAPQVTVEVISSSSARVRWADFRPAPGLVFLEYNVQAALQLPGGSAADTAAASAVFQHRYRGGVVEHDIGGLIPFRTYVFSVQARYPQVGARTWAGRLETPPIALEHSQVPLDPPAPTVVVGDPCSGRDGCDEGAPGAEEAVAVLEYPDQEEGIAYQLEYALALGPGADEELRASQSNVWCAPATVEPLEGGCADGGEERAPRWCARLADVGICQSDPLKIALMQQVRFRLRAEQMDESTGARLWSSPSAPVAVGMAAPDNVAIAIGAAGGRMALQVQFSLDGRLADVLATAGPTELHQAREELQQAIQAGQGAGESQGSSLGAVHMASSAMAGEASGHAALRALHDGPRTWPRGFGHALARRCQLRLRCATRPDAAGQPAGAKEWGAWHVFSDGPLPSETEREAGFATSSLLTSTAAHSPHARWYSLEAPQLPGHTLMPGEAVQIGVRVGDGARWSSWKLSKDAPIAIPPPRAKQVEDAVKASWMGDVCTVSWPAAVAARGLDALEYQVMIRPDSSTLPERIGAIFVGAAAEGREVTHRPMLERALSKSSPTGGKAGGKAAQMLSVELSDLCKDVRYSFSVLARYPTIGVRTFTRLFETDRIAWTPVKEPAPELGGTSARRPPALEQVPVPGDARRLARWEMGGSGALVLLRWAGLQAPAKGEASELPLQFEVQASEEPDLKGRRANRGAIAEAQGRSWVQCTPTVVVLDGEPCAALRQLPFPVARFRLFDAAARLAGPASAATPAAHEQPLLPPVAEMRALGKGAPRTLGAQLRFALGNEKGAQRWATLCQVSFRAIGLTDSDAASWQEADPILLSIDEADQVSEDGSRQLSVLLREEDGLELGFVYEFKVRVGDRFRLGPWSEESKPLKFAVPPPVPKPNAGISCKAEQTTALLSWHAFGPDEGLAARMPSFSQLPVKYTVSVYSGEVKELVTRLESLSSSVKIQALTPGTCYSATLVAAWTRFECADPFDSGEGRPLMAAFTTAPSHWPSPTSTSTLMPGYPRSPMALETLAPDPAEMAAARRTAWSGSYPQMRSPAAPSSSRSKSARVTLEMAAAPLEGAGAPPPAAGALPPAAGADSPRKKPGALPRLIPMPPPKFEARDHLTMATIGPPLTDRGSYAKTPRNRALTRQLAIEKRLEGGEQ